MSTSKYARQIKHRKTHYKPLTVDLRPETLEAFREACQANGSSMAREIKQFIQQYLVAATLPRQ